MNFVKLLEEKENLINPILNIILVYDDKRPSYLLEISNNYGDYNIIDDVISFFSLKKTEIFSIPDYPRFLIYKNDIEIPTNCIELGKVLGMTYLNNDYCDYTKFRNAFHILEEKSNTDIYTEIVIDNNLELYHNIISNRVKSFNETMKKYNLPYIFNYNVEFIPGTKTRQEKLKDYNYIKNNFDDYKNDFWNFDEELLEDISPKIIYQNYSLFNHFYQNINY